ncbi:hypothetical protein GCM10028798_27740 [Humibacter antri]
MAKETFGQLSTISILVHTLIVARGPARPEEHPAISSVAGLAEGSHCIRVNAIILYMTTLSVANARANLSKLIESAVTTHERFEVTRNGSRAAVLLSADDYDSLLETVDILSHPDEVEAIREGLADLALGQVSTADEVRAAMAARGRLTA